MAIDERFSSDFRALNRVGDKEGPEPLKWQVRLFERFCANDVPKVCDLPTGVGKTTVIHLWALALRRQLENNQPRLPTRLIYVVDRRTVVDQATEVAERIQRNLPELGVSKQWLSVSTLRGQFADNREWAADPSRRAIIIGTVDMIGSRLLFSGYRSSFKLRPLDAGMLGQDALLVLDEAHLSQPFAKLIRAVEGFQGKDGMPMRLMSMSATATISDDESDRFKLDPADLEGDEDTNPILRRYHAKKRLVLQPPVEKNRLGDALINAAVESTRTGNSRVVVFARKPGDVVKIEAGIRKRAPDSAVEVLTGTMRGLERDKLVWKPVLQRFLDGEEKPEDTLSRESVFLVSTSAGEVGFDLNADHMVCDAAPIDSMIQRLGRVNRRGYGNANIHVITAKVEENAKAKKSRWETAASEAIECLKQLKSNDDGSRDASPMAIDQLKQGSTRGKFEAALSPTPDTVELTDILLDAWSMTTITRPMPGRPPVAPWLRGVDEEEPQTTIAWRAELDAPGFGELEIEDIEDWFDAHRVLPHEILAVPARTAGEWIVARWRHLSSEVQAKIGDRPCIVDRAGVQVFKIRSIVEELERKRSDPIRSSDIVLPASFGGIQRGMLDENAPDPAQPPASRENESPSVCDVADADGTRERRIVVDGVEAERTIVGGTPQDAGKLAQFTLELRDDGDIVTKLISLVPKQQRPEYGTDRQTLQKHVSLVERYAGEIAERLRLSDVICESLRLASKWHDQGKSRERWQAAAGRRPGEEPLGKSGGFLGRVAGGYRHEFGSLRAFSDAYQGKISEDVFDLAMHIMAAHHGRGRPHFPKGGFDPDARDRSVDIALEAVRRFALLQRRYGYWQLAWLENLLRCADAMASADKGGQA